jgi:hypothetical protein
MTKRFLTPISLANLSADPTGSSGAFYYNTSANTLKYYNGTTWITLGSATTSLIWIYLASGAVTTVSGTDINSQTLVYTVGSEQVYLNGVLQVRGTDYTATNGSSIVFASAISSGDYVEVVANATTTIIIPTLAPINSPTFTGTVTVPATGIVYPGATSGQSILAAPAVAGTNTAITLPSTAGILALNPTTTKGDLIIASATGTPGTLSRLAPSATNNYVLGYNITSAAPQWQVNDFIVPYSKSGSFTTFTGTLRYSPPFGCTILGVSATLGTASSSGAMTFDVLKNGTSIFSTKPTIAQSATATASEFTTFSTSSLNGTTDYLTVSVTIAGTGTADLVVSVRLAKA